jgi:NAD(P)-dependent dehydrogenase (short-subunit alcohol dehydrogenase family)
MTSITTKTWLITGAGRGMGVAFAQAALAAGHNVVATGRNPDTVARAVGEHDNLRVTRLDITDAQRRAGRCGGGRAVRSHRRPGQQRAPRAVDQPRPRRRARGGLTCVE